MGSMLRLIAMMLLAALIATTGSGCIVKPDVVVTAPDSPVVIVEARGYVKVMSYSKERARLVDPRWIEVDEYVAWTLTKYDWEARAERDRNARTDGSSDP